jgi:hypothetical protein
MNIQKRLVGNINEQLIELYSCIDQGDLSYMVEYYVENIISDGVYNGDAYDDNGDIVDDLKDDAFGWLVGITADYITNNLALPTHKEPNYLNHKWYMGEWSVKLTQEEDRQLNIRGIVGYYMSGRTNDDLSPILSTIREMKLDLILM